VSQISPPIRILLVLAVAVLGAYMMFLRPKPEETVPPPTEPAGSVSAPGKLRDKAEDAAAAANARTAEVEGADGVEAGEAAAGTAAAKKQGAGAAVAAPSKDLAGVPKPVRRAIRKDKVLVLLFWNPKAADDRSVRAALGDVNRWDGRVFVHAAPLRRISRYGRIARGVSVEQSPTIVVADRDLRAETLVGYVDRLSIDQAVVDALRNSTGLFQSAYLREVNTVCARHSSSMAALPNYYGGDGPRDMDRRLTTYQRRYGKFAADFKAVKAPKRWAGFKAATVADLDAGATHIAALSAAVTPSTSIPAIVAAEAQYKQATAPIAKRANKRLDAENLLLCGSHF
jgi:hypothetical protein